MERTILHSDMNSCFASIEMMLNPELREKAVAVGGSQEDRHGIILAKSDKAKKCGVKTGEAIWQAKQKCKDLIVVPPHFEQYVKYSNLAREIYRRYTDLIEPFGLDECWLDVTGSAQLFGNGYDIAYKIKETMKFELGITVSVGVSFNKIFAKLGSDMKKPDAITVIDKKTFKNTIWQLPASELLGVGRATTAKLNNYGIYTIGDLANCKSEWLKLIFGKGGLELWSFANGYDASRVMPDGYYVPIKSIGHGITCTCDLVNETEVWRVFLQLSQDVSRKLKQHHLNAAGIQITVKTTDLRFRQYQTPLKMPTQSATEMAVAAIDLFNRVYTWADDVRAVTIRAINLQAYDMPVQLDLYNDSKNHDRQEKIDNTVMEIRRRFGEDGIFNCCLMEEKKIPKHDSKTNIMPAYMFR